MMDIMQFLQENNYIIAAVLWVIGELIKKTELIQEKYIPLFLLPFGIVSAFWALGFNANSFFQGILCVGGAVLIHKFNNYRKDANQK